MKRLEDLIRFYNSMSRLENKIDGRRLLTDCNGRMKWPERGVYFFMENGEDRSDSGQGLRIVRVGTHALTNGSKTTLWRRLSQHKGQEKAGGGNHRGSIFRLIVGTALDKDHKYPTWGQGQTAARDLRSIEDPLEKKVSQIIRAMPFLWLPINDEPSRDSLRAYIERNSIALLSNSGKEKVDLPSRTWIGHECSRERVRSSGLWNQNHVDEEYEPEFLDALDRLIDDIEIL